MTYRLSLVSMLALAASSCLAMDGDDGYDEEAPAAEASDDDVAIIPDDTPDGDGLDELDESEPEIQPDVVDVPIKAYRSLMVVQPKAMETIGDKLPLGTLLKRLGKRTITEWAPAKNQNAAYPLSKLAQWVRHPFRTAEREFDDHNELPYGERIGIHHNGNPYRRLQQLWPGLDGNVGGGPFRLLAVVNRQDLAGDVDRRGIIDAAREPRNFGEARLIFGLADQGYENAKGKPYPMTFIIEFRLPALNASYKPIDGYDYPGHLFDDAEWRTQMERWGRMWRQLSSYDQDSAAFRDHLAIIVNRFARPENFVSIRSNVELRNNGTKEFELREWYMLRNNQWVLIPRKPRDEPYKCTSDGPDLDKLVDYFWDPAHADLDMARVTPADPETVVGYNIPRSVGNAPIALGDPIPGCPKQAGKPVLFEMKGTDGNGTSRFTAPFGRVKSGFVWNVKNSYERRRHQFAIRTCTGCHSKEAGVFGFHVAPRMPGKQSKLSSFLTGGASFDHGNKSYAYDELKSRKAFLARASSADPGLTLFEGLYRDDEL